MIGSEDPVERLLASGLVSERSRVGLLANQISYSHARGRYLFQILADRCPFLRVFIPEHGLFAELQDQIPLADANPYTALVRNGDVEWVSLYGEEEGSLRPDVSLLADLDVLIVDLQDVGARYYTFLTTAWYAMEAGRRAGASTRFVIVDRPNPAGRLVEGSALQARYASFVGVPGVLHRHGMTAGELLTLYAERSGREEGLEVSLSVLPARDEAEHPPWEICPSPNMPSPWTPLVYAGQCLLEGTNVSEGRGTTRPFEIFGAPWIDPTRPLPAHLESQAGVRNLRLRPLRFLPQFHKYAGTVCNGWQLHTGANPFHSLLFTLDLIRYLCEEYSEFAWRTETYEYRSDLLAIEMLCGDSLLLDYLHGRSSRSILLDHLRHEESRWVDLGRAYIPAEQALSSSLAALETV